MFATLALSVDVLTALAGTTVTHVSTRKGAPFWVQPLEEPMIPEHFSALGAEEPAFVRPPKPGAAPNVPEWVVLVSELLTEACVRPTGESSCPTFFLSDRLGGDARCCPSASTRIPKVVP